MTSGDLLCKINEQMNFWVQHIVYFIQPTQLGKKELKPDEIAKNRKRRNWKKTHQSSSNVRLPTM